MTRTSCWILPEGARRRAGAGVTPEGLAFGEDGKFTGGWKFKALFLLFLVALLARGHMWWSVTETPKVIEPEPVQDPPPKIVLFVQNITKAVKNIVTKDKSDKDKSGETEKAAKEVKDQPVKKTDAPKPVAEPASKKEDAPEKISKKEKVLKKLQEKKEIKEKEKKAKKKARSQETATEEPAKHLGLNFTDILAKGENLLKKITSDASSAGMNVGSKSVEDAPSCKSPFSYVFNKECRNKKGAAFDAEKFANALD